MCVCEVGVECGNEGQEETKINRIGESSCHDNGPIHLGGGGRGHWQDEGQKDEKRWVETFSRLCRCDGSRISLF